MKNLALIILSVFILVITLVLLLSEPQSSFNSASNNASPKNLNNSYIEDGTQFITINAKGGYTPRLSVAKADIPTKLIVKTDNTYDCSIALVIRSIGYQNILPQTGEEIIDIGIPKQGEKFKGTCSMGMYNFQIIFQ